jgi:hypothetical protein
MLLTVWQDDVLLHPAADGWQWAASIFRNIIGSPMLWLVFFILFIALLKYADARTAAGRWTLGILHTTVHMAIILALVSLLPPANAWILAHTPVGSLLPAWFMPGSLSFFFLFAAEMIFIGGLAAGIVWGVYLLLTCGIAGIHDNDAFSAMRLGWYRHFLRLRIKDDELTIYPIGIDRPPRRSLWQSNPARRRGEQNQPEVIPGKPLKPQLIEGPIVIRCS